METTIELYHRKKERDKRRREFEDALSGGKVGPDLNKVMSDRFISKRLRKLILKDFSKLYDERFKKMHDKIR